jgi:hypothetical protein
MTPSLMLCHVSKVMITVTVGLCHPGNLPVPAHSSRTSKRAECKSFKLSVTEMCHTETKFVATHGSNSQHTMTLEFMPVLERFCRSSACGPTGENSEALLLFEVYKTSCSPRKGTKSTPLLCCVSIVPSQLTYTYITFHFISP